MAGGGISLRCCGRRDSDRDPRSAPQLDMADSRGRRGICRHADPLCCRKQADHFGQRDLSAIDSASLPAVPRPSPAPRKDKSRRCARLRGHRGRRRSAFIRLGHAAFRKRLRQRRSVRRLIRLHMGVDHRRASLAGQTRSRRNVGHVYRDRRKPHRLSRLPAFRAAGGSCRVQRHCGCSLPRHLPGRARVRLSHPVHPLCARSGSRRPVAG